MGYACTLNNKITNSDAEATNSQFNILKSRLCVAGSELLCSIPTQISTEFVFRELLAALLLRENSGTFKPRPYFWHEIRSSTHREQFGESRRPSEDI